MMILSDCLEKKTDEGCLKTAASLAKRLKESRPSILAVSYGGNSAEAENSAAHGADIRLHLNRLFLNRELFSMIRREKGQILYIPFASNTLASVVRVFVLSAVSKGRVLVLFALRHPMGRKARFLLRRSGAKVLALSEQSRHLYEQSGAKQVIRLRLGVDTKRFKPADPEEKARLREKYGIAKDARVVLHVGHLKTGRNVRSLLDVPKGYQVILVVSSVTAQEESLRDRLEAEKNIRIIDTYIERIEEIYQAADIYFFPVSEPEHCIDSPLSVLEAASCGLPVVAAAYEGLTDFLGQPGFAFLTSFDGEKISRALEGLTASDGLKNRRAVMDYDWDKAVLRILQEEDRQ